METLKALRKCRAAISNAVEKMETDGRGHHRQTIRNLKEILTATATVQECSLGPNLCMCEGEYKPACESFVKVVV